MSQFDDILGADIDTRSEKAIQNDSLVELSAIPDSIFWRQNTGQAWQGRRLKCSRDQTVIVQQGMVILQNARPVDFGLLGSGDIMGAAAGKPLAVELKRAVRSDQRKSQEHFERAWVKAGGIYILARSVEEAVNGVRLAIHA